LRAVTVRIPEAYIEAMKKLVKAGLYPSVSEVIRVAIRDLVRKDLTLINRETNNSNFG
jgi:Arc/MetJ-type ribon-helix-helix transcriptional regulator